MKIFGNERFSVYIHENDHPPPHCHVRFVDKSEVCVMIPIVEPMYGATISHEIREEIENKLEPLTKAWEKIHPKRLKTVKDKSHSTIKTKIK